MNLKIHCFRVLLGTAIATGVATPPSAARAGTTTPAYCVPGATEPKCSLPRKPATADDLKECYFGKGDSRIVGILDQPVAISFTNRAGDNFDMEFVKVLGHTGGAVIFHGKASVDTNGRFIANALCDTGGGCAAPDPFRLMLSGRLSSDGGAIDVTLQAVGCFANGAGEPDACAFPELGFVNVRAVPCE